ncbi:MAG: PLP-dependent aminotransferase family protein [Gemmatimonadota bacterium]
MEQSSSITRLVQLLRRDVVRLGPGKRLPTVRALMARHRVSPVTVRHAVATLVSEGLIDARPGHGTFVAEREEPAPAMDFGWQAAALGPARISAEAIEGMLALPVPGAINLAGGYPSEDLQALSLVSTALGRAARRPGVWGRMPLEGIEALRAWFARQIGDPITSHEVLICPGSQAAIGTAFSALTTPGSPLLIESPTYVGAIVAARAAGLELVPVPTDRDGVLPEHLARAFARSGARLFYCQPTYANPTGASLSAERRRQVLDVVAAAGAILIEDDWCRDLSLEAHAPRPLINSDRNGHCVYLRSLTKSAAPGLRIAAICARGAALTRLTASRVISDFFVPGPIQEAALEVVHAPAWLRHLRVLRATLAERRDVLAAAVRQHFGDASLAVLPMGGMHLWVRLGDRVDDVALARRAAAAKISVSPGRHWFPAEATGSYLRMSYAGAPAESLGRAVATVGQLADQGGKAVRR